VTYIRKRIKVGFAINGANPALNIRTPQVTRLGFLKIGKLQTMKDAIIVDASRGEQTVL
jgi:hypothetical protein